MAVERHYPNSVEPAFFCPGCGHGVITRLLGEVLEEHGLEKKTIGSIGVGCSCHLTNAMHVDLVQSPHGRSSAVATGIHRAEPGMFVFSYQGDGDAYNIGFAETMNAAYRNENMVCIVVNNTNFGMTGGQMSWCTLEGQKTATSPFGRDISLTGAPIRVPEIIAGNFDVAYVARGAVSTPQETNKLKKYITNAVEAQMNGEGYSLIEVLAACPTNWGMKPVAAHKHLQEAVQQYYQLGELKARKGAE